MDHFVGTGCPECAQLKNAFRDATIALGRHHEERSGTVKNIAYIHKEAELYEANNNARRAFMDHREREHAGVAYA
jgi:hypothetical protein